MTIFERSLCQRQAQLCLWARKMSISSEFLGQQWEIIPLLATGFLVCNLIQLLFTKTSILLILCQAPQSRSMKIAAYIVWLWIGIVRLGLCTALHLFYQRARHHSSHNLDCNRCFRTGVLIPLRKIVQDIGSDDTSLILHRSMLPSPPLLYLA